MILISTHHRRFGWLGIGNVIQYRSIQVRHMKRETDKQSHMLFWPKMVSDRGVLLLIRFGSDGLKPVLQNPVILWTSNWTIGPVRPLAWTFELDLGLVLPVWWYLSAKIWGVCAPLVGFDHVTAYYSHQWLSAASSLTAFVFINSNAYNINITLLYMYQIPFRFLLPLQKAILAMRWRKSVSALVKGFRKICETHGQFLVKEITLKQVWIG
jgi:hypothetical protein